MEKFKELALLKTSVTVDDAFLAVSKAVEIGAECLAVPQWIVPAIKEEAKKSEICISTPIGLPGGNTSTQAKYAEAKIAYAQGADEIDIPMNMSLLKKGDLSGIARDIDEVLLSTGQKATTKIIVEVDDISEENLIEAIRCISDSKADYICLTAVLRGAPTVEQVKLVSKKARQNLKIKCSGGIRTQKQIDKLLLNGVSRIEIGMEHIL